MRSLGFASCEISAPLMNSGEKRADLRAVLKINERLWRKKNEA